MTKQVGGYSPRPGTKVAIAIEAINQQPRTARELCALLACTCSSVRAMLLRPLSHGAIIKVTDPQSGQVRYASPKMVSDARLEQMSPKTRQNTRHGKRQLSTSPAKGQPAKTANRPMHPPALSCPSSPSVIAESRSADLASTFTDGELTISANGKCIRLDAGQRHQLYSFLHKIRHIQ